VWTRSRAAGVRAAYIIEFIISDSINNVPLFWRGVIVKKETKVLDGVPKLTFEDMKILKRVYEKWRKSKKGSSLRS